MNLRRPFLLRLFILEGRFRAAGKGKGRAGLNGKSKRFLNRGKIRQGRRNAVTGAVSGEDL